MRRSKRRILLDECIDWRLSRHLRPHIVTSVAQAGWAGQKNGALLRLAESAFDVFITVDRNLFFQQNLADLELAVLILHAKSNSLDALAALMPKTLKALDSVKAGDVLSID